MLEERALPSFGLSGPYTVGNNPQGIAVGDFNGDHRPDLAVTNVDDNAVSILLANSDGTYLTVGSFATGGVHPTAIVAGDFTGDGKIDLIVANTSSNTVALLVGNGDGTFQSGQPINLGAGISGPIALAAVDFNKDNKLDLAVANNAGDAGTTVSVFLGNGNGTFTPSATLNVGTGPQALAAMDLNSDGKMDLAVADFIANDVRVFFGNGNGTFNAGPTIGVGTHPSWLTAGDASGDGKIDLVTTNSVDGTVSLIPGNGDGSFHSPQIISVGPNPQSVGIADFNQDGIPDLVVLTTADSSVRVLLGNGDGSFQAARTTATGISPVSMVVADLNGDCFPDLAVVNNTDQTVSVLLNLSTQFAVPVHYAAGKQPASVAIGDFNGDGFPDMAVANAKDGNVSIFLGRRDGTFQSAGSYFSGNDPVAIVTGDFNGDGKLDLAVANKGDADISLLEGNGNGTFNAPLTSPADLGPVSLVAGDFNRDGNLDLAVLNQVLGRVAILINDGHGQGTFHFFATYLTGLNPQTIATGDLRGIGVKDLVFDYRPGAPGPNVGVLLGNGDGTFQSVVNYSAGNGAVGLAVADLNGDGKPDVVVTNITTNTISVLLNNGNGTLKPAVSYAVGAAPIAVVASDFTHDGKPDLAVANSGDATVSLLVGSGMGLFKAAVPYDSGLPSSSPAALAVGFFNGGADLAVANAGANEVTVLLNETPGEIIVSADAGGPPLVKLLNARTGAVILQFNAYAPQFLGGVRVATGDVDGDGDPDIITAPGPGGGPDIRVFDPCTGELIREFMAYSPLFTGGVFVAVGDVNNDGFADIVTGADFGGGPHVEAFSGKDGSILRSFFAYDSGFLGGVRVATGDVEGNGNTDIITGPGPSGGPDVRVFSGLTGAKIQEFFAYDSGNRTGVYVAAGDVNGDGFADILVGIGTGVSANGSARVFSGRNDSVIFNFFPYPQGFSGGVRVGIVQDLNGDGLVDLVTGAGPSGGPHVEVFDGLTLAVLDSFFAYSGSFTGGVFVGGQ
jgi:hypothetical protein